MVNVDFKKYQCHMFLSLNISHVPSRIYKMAMSHVAILFEPMSLSLRDMWPYPI